MHVESVPKIFLVRQKLKVKCPVRLGLLFTACKLLLFKIDLSFNRRDTARRCASNFSGKLSLKRLDRFLACAVVHENMDADLLSG